jgi:hypothetical protein
MCDRERMQKMLILDFFSIFWAPSFSTSIIWCKCASLLDMPYYNITNFSCVILDSRARESVALRNILLFNSLLIWVRPSSIAYWCEFVCAWVADMKPRRQKERTVMVPSSEENYSSSSVAATLSQLLISICAALVIGHWKSACKKCSRPAFVQL